MNSEWTQSFQGLRHYVEQEAFRGWDPFDGLNSRLFRSIPLLKNNKWARLAWLQFHKRSPINFRPLTGVPKVYNAKGLALFVLGYAQIHRRYPSDETATRIQNLADQLLKMATPGYAGPAWGYPFDWQARAFFQPKGTPTVVATSFVAEALLAAYDLLGKADYLDTAVAAARFVLHDLNRTYDDNGDFTFSYSPLDRTQVFNAGLLGAKTLALIYERTGEQRLIDEARQVVRFVAKHQHPDGAWSYGTLPYHQWIDNFHTGYNLEAMAIYRRASGDRDFDEVFRKGMDYYLSRFWTSEGMPRYYHDRLYPIDLHAPAQLLATLHKSGLSHQHQELIRRVLDWTIRHMQSPKGYFYYQKRPLYTNKIPYMRWTQAWMFYGMAYHLYGGRVRQFKNT